METKNKARKCKKGEHTGEMASEKGQGGKRGQEG